MNPLFELRDVSVVRDGNTILDGLSLKIEVGEHTAILGPNGSGKSTLVRLLTHEIYPHAGVGEVKILGEDRWSIRDLRPMLGLVSPTPAERFLGDPTVHQMVLSGLLGSYGVTWGFDISEEMVAKADRLLEFVEMSDKAHRKIETLSAGELRRVLIARALVSEPTGLLLDEPTTSLDLRSSLLFRQTMRRTAQSGTTLVLVTHHLEEVVPEIQNVILLKGGKVFTRGGRSEVMRAETLAELFDVSVGSLHEELDRTGALAG